MSILPNPPARSALLMRSCSTWPSAPIIALVVAFQLTPAATATAQLGVSDRAVPGTYAITNARIVPVSGPTIARGTVVIRNGLIVGVGAGVATPADARVIDASGHTVYPGLIDALSHVGIPAPRSTGGGGGAAAALFGQAAAPQSQATAPNSLHPAGLQPEIR